MSSLGTKWAGHIYGTNTGNVFAELVSDGDNITGTVRLLDNAFGVAVLAARGRFSDGHLVLEGEAVEHPEDVEFGIITIEGDLTPEGQLRGDWKSTLGTGGTFVLFPHNSGPSALSSGGLPSERIHTATRDLGAVRMGLEDLRQLLQVTAAALGGQQPVVTFFRDGLETTRYASDFLADLEGLVTLKSLRVNGQRPEAYGINRSISIDLPLVGPNQIRVQGVDPIWVRGTAEVLGDTLRRHERRLATGLLKWGLNFNSLLVIATIAVLPDLALANRLAFISLMAAMVLVIARLHRRYIPNAVVYLTSEQTGFATAFWPQLVSWAIALTSAFVAAVAYGFLKGELVVANWLEVAVSKILS